MWEVGLCIVVGVVLRCVGGGVVCSSGGVP